MDAIEVAGEMSSLDDVAAYVKQASQQAGLANREAYRLRLAVEEILTNTITHGYEENHCTGTVRVAGEVEPGRVTIRLEDDAPKYDPRDAPEPDVDAALGDRPIGGLGVFLVLQGLDDFRYDHVGGRNVNALTVRTPVSVPSEA